MSDDTAATTAAAVTTTADESVSAFCEALAKKVPTPGGGAAAAIGAAIGAAAAVMSANYSQRKKDVESGNAAKALKVVEDLNIPTLLGFADRDAAAYADLQRSWKSEMPAEEKAQIEATALA